METTMNSGIASTITTTNETSIINDMNIHEESTDFTSIESTENVEERNPSSESADEILESAKQSMADTGSFEETLIRLANGEFDYEDEEIDDFDEGEIVTDDEDKNTVDKSSKTEGDLQSEIKNDQSEENKIEQNEEEEEIIELRARIVELEDKVGNLEEKNKELSEKLKATETAQQVSLKILLEMALILHEMAKEEEDEKKKESLLELLVTMMSSLMQAMFVPEDTQNKGNATNEVKKAQSKASGNTSKRSIGEIIQMLKENGSIDNINSDKSSSVSSVAPNIENNAL